MKYAIGIVGNLNPYSAEAVAKTVKFIQEATPAPALILFLDWCIPAPGTNVVGYEGPLNEIHTPEAWDKRLPWYAGRAGFVRAGTAYKAIYPLHERSNWNRQYERTKPTDAASLPPVHWGKQQLIEEATAVGCERLLCLPPGMWLPADAPAILESGIRPGVVMTYPVMSVRCDLDGEPLNPVEGIGKPPRLTANDLGAGRIPHHDGWWIDLTQLVQHDPGRVCGFGAGDEAATLARILHAGEGQDVHVASFLADLPFAHKHNIPLPQPDEKRNAVKVASLAKHDHHLRNAIHKHKLRKQGA